jgi:hypothetical protein
MVEEDSVAVELIVMVVMEVSAEGDGHDSSGKSSWRFTFAAAPQPSRALPGCLFPLKVLVFALTRSKPEALPIEACGT